jgi:hypothetical protein
MADAVLRASRKPASVRPVEAAVLDQKTGS